MLDFKELGQDGKDFELFTREILNALGVTCPQKTGPPKKLV